MVRCLLVCWLSSATSHLLLRLCLFGDGSFLISGDHNEALRVLERRGDLQSLRFSVSLAAELGDEILDERRVRFALECVIRDEFRESEELLTKIDPASSWADKAAALFALCVTEQAVDPVLKGKGILLLSDLGPSLLRPPVADTNQ